MFATYTSAKTYQDEGVVQIRHVKKDKGLLDYVNSEDHIQTIKFTTAFIRDKQQFRFHFDQDGKPRSCYTVAAVGKRVKTWWTITPTKEGNNEESLTSALGIAAGISGTSSGKIPSLLLNEEVSQNWTIRQVNNWRLIKIVTQHNRQCYLFEGSVKKKEKVAIYIDTQNLLVLRINHLVDKSDAVFSFTMTYKPLLNKAVPAQAVAMVDVCGDS
jgi:hypothetical protein